MRTCPVTVLVFFLAFPALAAAQEVLSDATDTTTLSASDPFSEHAAGPYSPSEVSQNVPGTGLDKGDLPKIRRYAEHVIEQWQVPGLSIGIVQDGKIFMVEGFGVRDLDHTAPVDGDTLFCIGSQTKAITTTAISMLVQDGLMDWDGPVVNYYPAFALQDPDLTEQILMRDIVSHRTGFNGPYIDSKFILRHPEFYNRYEIVAKLDEFPASFPIRSKFSYSNVYYTLAGVAMEEVTGKTWEEIVHERIFGPLGMSRSQTAFYEWPDDNYGRAFEKRDRRDPKKVPYYTVKNVAPAGAVISSAADMVKWLKFLLGKGTFEGEEILEAQYFDDMHRPHMPFLLHGPYLPGMNALGIFSVNTYGLGWVLSEYQGRKVIHHSGGCMGYRGFNYILPDEDFGVVVLTNLGSVFSRHHFAPEALAFRIIDEYLGQAKRDWSTEFYDVVWGE